MAAGLLACVLVWSQAWAQATPGLYDVRIEVADESTAERNRAFAEGLREMFVRLSGDSHIAQKLSLPPATGFVKQYSYQPLPEPVVNDAGEVMNLALRVQYNGHRIARLLQQQGLPVWGEHRPTLILWLLVRDGKRRYVMPAADASAIKAALEAAFRHRGVPLRWPLYDAADRKQLSTTDIRGGFREPLQAASARYQHGKGPILAGSLSWTGRGWQSEWTLLLNQAEKRWSQGGRDYQRVIRRSVDAIVDAMAEVYAVRELAPDAQGEPVFIHVAGIATTEAYKRGSDYLASMPAVKRLGLVHVDGRSVEFVLHLRTDRKTFLALLKNDGFLIEAEPPPKKEKSAPEASAKMAANKAEKKPAEAMTGKSADASALTPAAGKARAAPASATPGQEKSATAAKARSPRQVYYFRMPE